MELLGAYSSQLTPAYYQQLLALLDAAISSGDLSGGSAFNQNALLALEQQAQSFDQLPTGTSGSRVTDDSFNYPFVIGNIFLVPRVMGRTACSRSWELRRTTSFPSRGPVCHHPDPLPANRPEKV